MTEKTPSDLKNRNENGEKVKIKNNLKSGDQNDDNPINGRDLILLNKIFSQKMAEFIETVKKIPKLKPKNRNQGKFQQRSIFNTIKNRTERFKTK